MVEPWDFGRLTIRRREHHFVFFCLIAARELCHGCASFQCPRTQHVPAAGYVLIQTSLLWFKRQFSRGQFCVISTAAVLRDSPTHDDVTEATPLLPGLLCSGAVYYCVAHLRFIKSFLMTSFLITRLANERPLSRPPAAIQADRSTKLSCDEGVPSFNCSAFPGGRGLIIVLVPSDHLRHDVIRSPPLRVLALHSWGCGVMLCFLASIS